MAKRLVVLAGMLAVLLAAAAPAAFAQQEIAVTGVVEDLGSSQLPPYGLRDETTGGVYYLASDEVDFGVLAGERITAFGTPEEVVRSVVLNVSQVEPADGPPPGEEFATLTFELAVEGTPPADATFFGYLGQEPTPFRLTDPDGDGVYTASTPEGLIPAGDVQPARIVQGTQEDASVGTIPGEPIRTIRDFGEVTFEEDTTLSASVSFPDNSGSIDDFVVNFELAVEGEPPADTTFFGQTPLVGGSVRLTDPDGDGLYTGSLSGRAAVQDGVATEAAPVQIVQGIGTSPSGTRPDPAGTRPTIIRDFGWVEGIENGQTFAASVSFDDDPTPGTVTATGVLRAIDPECNECPRHAITDEASGTEYGLVSDPRNPNGGVDLNAYVGQRVTIYGVRELVGPPNFLYVTRVEPADGSDNGGSDDGSYSSGSGSGDAGNGSITGDGSSGGGWTNILPGLPITGGTALMTLGVGVLLVGGGFLIRRLARYGA